jgi:hypothetical protein
MAPGRQRDVRDEVAPRKDQVPGLTRRGMLTGLGAALLLPGPLLKEAPKIGWSSQVTVANKLIVYGSGAGAFVYNGTPAAGNPPIFWATSASTDPFGNSLPSTTGVAGTGSFEAGNTIINDQGMFVYSGTPTTGNLIASIAEAQGTDTYGNVYNPGVWSYNGAQQTGIEDGELNLTSNGTQFWTIAADSASGDLLIEFPVSNGYLFVTPTGQVVPAQPGTTTPETWHDITLDSGWSTSSGYAPLGYRLLPDGNVQLRGMAQHSAVNGATNINGSNPIPSAYRPTYTLDPVYIDTVYGRCHITVNTSGVLVAHWNATSGDMQAELDNVIYYPGS